MTVLSRYLVTRYLLALLACWSAAGLVLFLLELFGKSASFDTYDTSATAVTAYLVLKIPNLLLDAYPATTLFAVLLSFGLLARNNEILAIRAGGVSPWRMLRAVLATSVAVSVFALAWAEYVVPVASSRSRLIRDSVIKRRETYSGREATAMWLRTKQGFLRAEYYDSQRLTIYGIRLFEADPAMHLRRIIEGPSAKWDGTRWRLAEGTVKTVAAGGEIDTRIATDLDFELGEAPVVFEKRRPKAKEMTYPELSAFIRGLENRGVATREFRVERHLRLAWPVTGIVAVLLGFPLAVRGGRRFGIGYNIATGSLVGFSYWFLFALCSSAGRSGILSPVLAAWTPNVVFALFSVVLLSRRNT
jgi:lipopolysaccharide export system permease protein